MGVPPIVRYMILCDDWGINAFDEKRADIYGLLTEIIPEDQPPFPFTYVGLCVFLMLTEVRGIGRGYVRAVFEQTGEEIFRTTEFEIRGQADLLEIIAMPVRIVECEFPRPGTYSVQFWYNDNMIQECPLKLRDLL